MSAPNWGRSGRGPFRPGGPVWGNAAPAWDRHRVYRDTERGWIAGVCAGIADYLGTPPTPVRVAAVLCLIFFFLPTLVAYAAFAIVLKPKPPELFATSEEEAFWRGLHAAPAQALHALRDRFRGVDRRLARMETLVTSDEFDLRRAFRDIGG